MSLKSEIVNQEDISLQHLQLKSDERSGSPLSDWIVRQCTILSAAIYDNKPDKYVERNGSMHGFSSFAVSGTGNYLITDVKKGLNDYTFISFRGLKTFDEYWSEKTERFMKISVLDCLVGFPCSVVDDALRNRRNVILTGHCFGGICAVLEAVRFYSATSTVESNSCLQCITFGCPVIGGDAFNGHMSQFRQFFYNFILPEDKVPFLHELIKPLSGIISSTIQNKEIPRGLLAVNWTANLANSIFTKSFGYVYSVHRKTEKIEIMSNANFPRSIGYSSLDSMRGFRDWHKIRTYKRHISNCAGQYYDSTPHAILEKVCPLVSIMIDVHGDGQTVKKSSDDSDILRRMYHHCASFADSIPLDFAFRILLYHHTEEKLPYINTFLNRVDQIEFDIRDLGSSITVHSIRTLLERLKSKEFDVDKMREKCGEYIFAFGKNINSLDIHSNNISIKSPLLPNEAFIYENQTPLFQHFWELVCVKRIGIILDFSNIWLCSDKFRKELADRWYAFDYSIKYKSKNMCEHGVIHEYSVTRDQDNIDHTVYVIEVTWGQTDTPTDNVFRSLLSNYKSSKEKGTLNNVYIRDCKNGAAATFILTRVLSKMTKEEIKQLSHNSVGMNGILHDSSELESQIPPASEEQIEFSRRYAQRLEFGFLGGNALKGTITIFESLLKSIEKEYKSNNEKFASDAAISIQYVVRKTNEPAPFFSLIEKPVTVENVMGIDSTDAVAVHEIMTKAKYARFNARMVATIVEDVMEFDKACLEIEREDKTKTFGRARRVLGAAFKTLVETPYVALNDSWQAAKERHRDIWRSVDFTRIPYSSYADMVKLLFDEISGNTESDVKVADMEAYIDGLIPESVKSSDLRTIMRNKNAYFAGSILMGLLDGMSGELVVFYLKTIHHCRALRILREDLKLITIGGEANVGKSSLVEYFVGEGHMIDEPGIGLENRTLLPVAYRDEGDASMIWCDLPGCTDKHRMDLSKLFTELGDVVVFLLNAATAEEFADKSLEQLVDYIVNRCTCPRLVCINQADCYIKSTRRRNREIVLNHDEIINKLDQACNQWRHKELFESIERKKTPALEMETSKPHAHILNSSDGLLSVWLTCFSAYHARNMTGQTEEYLEQIFFTEQDVKNWVLTNRV